MCNNNIDEAITNYKEFMHDYNTTFRNVTLDKIQETFNQANNKEFQSFNLMKVVLYMKTGHMINLYLKNKDRISREEKINLVKNTLALSKSTINYYRSISKFPDILQFGTLGIAKVIKIGAFINITKKLFKKEFDSCIEWMNTIRLDKYKDDPNIIKFGDKLTKYSPDKFRARVLYSAAIKQNYDTELKDFLYDIDNINQSKALKVLKYIKETDRNKADLEELKNIIGDCISKKKQTSFEKYANQIQSKISPFFKKLANDNSVSFKGRQFLLAEMKNFVDTSYTELEKHIENTEDWD